MDTNFSKSRCILGGSYGGRVAGWFVLVIVRSGSYDGQLVLSLNVDMLVVCMIIVCLGMSG